MNLADWLSREKIKRVDFAARIGVTPQSITGYCDGEFWPKKEIAQRIFEETNGEVTPTDFMLIPKRTQA
jgi:3,4-dihydroxy 2-butanone 4-phosphate synthase/GTP cyclohydrolase II